MKLVAYIRGGLGDTWIAITALKPIIDKYNISKFDITIITDSVYYFRVNYSDELERFSIDTINKISPNIIKVSPFINNNFRIAIDDVTDELSQENADKFVNEFMFWRPPELKEFVRKFIGPDTIFVDCPFAECIMKWNCDKQKYERIGDKRAQFQFNPSKVEKGYIDDLLSNPKHILIHTRKKQEGTSHVESDKYYNEIIKFCNAKQINVIILGTDTTILHGDYVDLRGETPLSFEGFCYLLDECNIMLGSDSGVSHIKLYQQQRDKLLIMDHARYERSNWCKDAFKKSNCLLLDAKKGNVGIIKNAIGEYYENK